MQVALGFDFGSKRIGTAIGNQTLGSARGLGWISSPQNDQAQNDQDWLALDKLIAQWQPQILLVGAPLTEDGEKQAMTRKARHFAHQLRARFALPVQEVDERYSSCSAESELVAARSSGKKSRLKRGDSDSLAAAIIVQQWLDEH